MHTTQNPIRMDGNRTANPTLNENRWQYNQPTYTTLLSLCYSLLCYYGALARYTVAIPCVDKMGKK